MYVCVCVSGMQNNFPPVRGISNNESLKLAMSCLKKSKNKHDIWCKRVANLNILVEKAKMMSVDTLCTLSFYGQAYKFS